MLPTQQGSLRLFRLFGITVYLHWSWFLVAVIRLQYHGLEYGSYVWYGLEYLSLFLIVLMHEFGHALACRSVGGRADQIVLWPLGGVAYVAPPPRAGAVLWSIVAGPLVNAVLAPILTVVLFATGHAFSQASDVYGFVEAIWFANLVLLFFNLLPIYPLDGGKILWALLWFPFGRARALMIAAILGGVVTIGLIPFIIKLHDAWLYVLVAFVLLNCWKGWQEARALARLEEVPRRNDLACPVCKANPMRGDLWRCARCGKAFDIFGTAGICPHCTAQYNAAACFECGSLRPLNEWQRPFPPSTS